MAITAQACVIASAAPTMRAVVRRLKKDEDYTGTVDIRLFDVFKMIAGQKDPNPEFHQELVFDQIKRAIEDYKVRVIVLVGCEGNKEEATRALFAAYGVLKEQQFRVIVRLYWMRLSGKLEKVALDK